MALQILFFSILTLILFGKSPRDKAYQAVLDDIIDGSMVVWDTDNGEKQLVDGGIIERFIDAMKPFISKEASQIDEYLRREIQWFYLPP